MSSETTLCRSAGQRRDEYSCGGGQPLCARRIYVASSSRNTRFDRVVTVLRAAGFDAYDFKHPIHPDERGFAWSDTGLLHAAPVADPGAPELSNTDEFLEALEHESAITTFDRDFAAMHAADTVVLVLPCGRSAHLELGWAIGAGKRTAVLLDDPCVPELMYRAVDCLARTTEELLQWLCGGRRYLAASNGVRVAR